MVKILLGFLLFVVFIFAALNFWDKTEKSKKNKYLIAGFGLLVMILILIGYVLYN